MLRTLILLLAFGVPAFVLPACAAPRDSDVTAGAGDDRDPGGGSGGDPGAGSGAPTGDGATGGGPTGGGPTGGGPTGGSSGFVKAAGGSFVVDGKPFRMVGANRYDLTSFAPSTGKYRCGNAYEDAAVDTLLDELHTSSGANVVRMWAFQSFTLGGTNFSTIDRAIASARRHGLRIIFALENEWVDCTEKDPTTSDGRKGGAWYRTGYTKPVGTYPLSYRDYVAKLVARYANEPAIAMWQLLNEGESDDAAALQAFAADMAGVIKKADPNHLVTVGTLGSGQAGIDNALYRQLYATAGIDVVEAHDYNDVAPLPGSPTSTANSIYADLTDAKALGKPFLIGEVGIAAPTPMYPTSYAQRAQYIDAKLSAGFAAGVGGVLVWSFYDLKSDNWQGWDYGPTDPLAAVLKKYSSP